jgi:hypothetical protein
MHLTGVVEVDPEVLVVEDSLDGVVRRIVCLVLTASGGLDEEILLNLSRSSADQDPSVESLTSVFIIRLVIGLIVIDSDTLSLFILLRLGSVKFSLFIEFGLTHRLLNNLESFVFLLNFLAFGSLHLVLIDCRIFVAHLIVIAKVERTDHETLVLSGDILRSSSIADISVIPSTNENGTKSNSEIKGISFLPVKNVSDRRDMLR